MNIRKEVCKETVVTSTLMKLGRDPIRDSNFSRLDTVCLKCPVPLVRPVSLFIWLSRLRPTGCTLSVLRSLCERKGFTCIDPITKKEGIHLPFSSFPFNSKNFLRIYYPKPV